MFDFLKWYQKDIKFSLFGIEILIFVTNQRVSKVRKRVNLATLVRYANVINYMEGTNHTWEQRNRLAEKIKDYCSGYGHDLPYDLSDGVINFVDMGKDDTVAEMTKKQVEQFKEHDELIW
jgi:hypothetical protein